MHERPVICPFRPTGAGQVVLASTVEDAFGCGRNAVGDLVVALRARPGEAQLVRRELPATRPGRS